MSEIRHLVLASAMAALIGIGAWIAIPIGPVPITLQVLFVYLTGLMLPVRYAGLTILLYVLMGTIGLPVFAGGGSGLGVVIGPMGGYFIGFLLASMLISALTSRLRTNAAARAAWQVYGGSVLACLLGSAMIFGLGAAWGKFATGLGWDAILTGWVLPFIPGDMIKIAAATLIVREVWQRDLLKGRYE